MVSYEELTDNIYRLVKVREGYSVQVRPFIDFKTSDFGLSGDDPIFDEKIKIFYGQNQIIDLTLETNLVGILLTEQFDDRRDKDLAQSLSRVFNSKKMQVEGDQI